MNIIIEAECNQFIQHHKEINKIAKWVKKHKDIYLSTANLTSNCVLVDDIMPEQVWCSIDDDEILKIIITHTAYKNKFIKILSKLSDFESVELHFDEYDHTKIYPYFTVKNNGAIIKVVVMNKSTVIGFKK